MENHPYLKNHRNTTMHFSTEKPKSNSQKISSVNLKFITFRKSFPKGVFNGDGDPRLESEAKFLRICNGDELEPLRSGVFNFLTPGPGDTFSSLIFFVDIFIQLEIKFLKESSLPPVTSKKI